MQTPALSSTSHYPNAQPFFGVVETTVQALRLVHAARVGVIPRVLRRLNGTERRKMIVSGAVFVFSVEESGIRRWTDSLQFSPSRIDGNFLVYKEMNERSSGSRMPDRFGSWISMSGEGGREVHASPHEQPEGQYRSKISFATSDASGFKVGGLIKRTITVKIRGSDHHLVSYYTEEDISSGRFSPLSSRSDIMSLDLPPHIFNFSDFRTPPRLEIGRDGLPKIICEPETPQSVENLVLSREDVRGYNTSGPSGQQMHVKHNGSWSGSTLDNALGASSVRNHGVASSSGHNPADDWQEQFGSQQMVPRYQYQQGASSEGRHEHDQYSWGSPSMGDGLSLQYQRERWLSSRPTQLADHDMSSLTPNTYFSTSQMRESERNQSSGQTFETRYTEEMHGYNRDVLVPNNNTQSSISGVLDRTPTYSSIHQRTVDNAWPSNESSLSQPRHPELDNPATQSRSTGQTFVLGSQPYQAEPHCEEDQDHR